MIQFLFIILFFSQALFGQERSFENSLDLLYQAEDINEATDVLNDVDEYLSLIHI